jgi:hypothetical protein
MFSGKTRSVAIHSIQIQSSADGFPLGSSLTPRSFLTFNHPDITALKHDYLQTRRVIGSSEEPNKCWKGEIRKGHGLFEERRVS